VDHVPARARRGLFRPDSAVPRVETYPNEIRGCRGAELPAESRLQPHRLREIDPEVSRNFNERVPVDDTLEDPALLRREPSDQSRCVLSGRSGVRCNLCLVGDGAKPLLSGEPYPKAGTE
jgi:hypothetical protein